ncbi:site-specific integrase [Geomonas edaphica]|uniref:site-specific integrase n=1 Tax=Geomonas edaphica TaxID=2570226 RepID=UPI0010A7A339|nr:site-specific integrase [Geomonas edaphica]
MSYPTHLISRNGHFYYKIKVPIDLQQHFPSTFIKKSLKTTDLSIARAQLATMEYQTMRIFTLLRSGVLDDYMVAKLLSEIVPSVATTSSKVQVGIPARHSLSKMIKQYMEFKQPQWTPKTKMEMGGVFGLLLELLGDIDVTEITRETVLHLRATLMRLPPNLHKRYPDQTIKQLLDRTDMVPMSTKSVNKHVGGIGGVLRYCLDIGIVTANYAAGLKLSEKRRVDEERSIYSVEDITSIVNNLPCKQTSPERYWIPLIGCFSGMRLNEICQLYVEDILEVEGIWCFSVNGAKDKRLKNAASERMVPVHPVLVDLGLIEYCEKIRKTAAPRLWSNLTWMDVHGYSNGFGNWYQRFNRKHVTHDPKKVFHSFRHLVTDTLKQAGVQDSLIAELVGHSHGNHAMTMSRYGKRYQPKVLLEALKHLDYGIEIKRFDP